MEDNKKEEIAIEYLKNLIETDTNQCMMVFGSVLKQLSEKANYGQLKVTIFDKKDNPIWTLLFVTDEELIPELDEFINQYDINKPTN